MTSDSEACRDRVVAGIGETIAGFGFDVGPKRFSAGGFRFYRWRRMTPWKQDIVDLSHRAGKDIGALNISLSLELRCFDEEGYYVDKVDLNHLVGARQYAVPLPGLFGGDRCRKVCSAIAQDLQRGLSWFERYDTRERVLRALKQGENENGPHQGRIHDQMVSYLESLSDSSAPAPGDSA